MKKLILYSVIGLLVMALPLAIHAYTINDPVGDAIGERVFESYGINMYNYTPGIYSGPITFDLFTNYPQGGVSVSGWDTKLADLFVYETYYGQSYLWAIPLVSHNGFNTGTMYAVKNYNVSNYFDPSSGGLSYNHNIPVRIAEIGNNYGYSAFGDLKITWNTLSGGVSDYRINIVTGSWQDDPNGTYSLLWGTATCANDVVGEIPVPEPASLLLFGVGLIGLWGGKRKFNQ